MVQLSHLYVTTGKTIALTILVFVGKVMFLLFNTLSRFAIAFLPRSKRLLISWLQSLSAVILDPKKIKPVTVSTLSLSICHEFMGPDAMILGFLNVEFYANILTLLFHLHQDTLVPLHFLPLEWYHLHIWGCWYFSQKSWFQLVIHGAQHFAWCTLHIS